MRRASANKPAWVLVVRENLSKYEATVLQEDAQVLTSAAVSKLLAPRLGQEEVEVMVLIALDGQNHVKHLAEVSRGGMHGLSVAAKDILRLALVSGATAFILVHNHPSGNTTPSPEDVAMTRVVAEAGDVIGCPLLDHVILAGDGRHTSMVDRGIMPFS